MFGTIIGRRHPNLWMNEWMVLYESPSQNWIVWYCYLCILEIYCAKGSFHSLTFYDLSHWTLGNKVLKGQPENAKALLCGIASFYDLVNFTRFMEGHMHHLIIHNCYQNATIQRILPTLCKYFQDWKNYSVLQWQCTITVPRSRSQTLKSIAASNQSDF